MSIDVWCVVSTQVVAVWGGNPADQWGLAKCVYEIFNGDDLSNAAITHGPHGRTNSDATFEVTADAIDTSSGAGKIRFYTYTLYQHY